LVKVQVGDGDRALTFARTLVRVQPTAFTEMHIDTDEANAAGIGPGFEGQIAQGITAQVGG
jgi:acetate kinase